ncbi:hypothetical protein [Cohnella sp. 56]|uniref:hypothetical protein n=1 Tax=Cohnella sp. 56 TaxID=3113722 RepID=UPI0030E91346
MRKQAIVAVLSALLLLQGCGERTAQPVAEGGHSPPPSSSAPNAQLPKASVEAAATDLVPRLDVTVGGEVVVAQMGSYCWHDDVKGKGVCADAAMPPSFENLNAVPRSQAGDEISLAWSVEPPPDGINAHVSFPGQERPDEAVELRDGAFRAAAGAGDQLYVINAAWPQGAVPYYFGLHVEGDDEADSLRELAWEALTEGDKQSVVGDWREAEVEMFDTAHVSLLIVQEKFQDDESLNGRSLQSVTFHTQNDALLGPITAVFDRASQKLIGWLPRE